MKNVTLLLFILTCALRPQLYGQTIDVSKAKLEAVNVSMSKVKLDGIGFEPVKQIRKTKQKIR